MILVVINMYYSANETQSCKTHLFAYVILQMLLGIAIILAASSYWFKYCVFNFGLYSVDDIYSDIEFDDETISDIQEDCSNDKFDSFTVQDDDGIIRYLSINYACKGFCDNIDSIRGASNAMIVMTSFTLVCLVLNVAISIANIIRPGVVDKWVYTILGSSASLLYLLGICIYVGIGDFSGYNECESAYFNCEDFEVRGGLILGPLIGAGLIGVTFYGFAFTQKDCLTN